MWHCRSPQLSHLGFSTFAHLVSEKRQQSSLDNCRQTWGFMRCLGCVPVHDYISHRSLIWWRECSRASGLCGSIYSHGELKETSSYIKLGLKHTELFRNTQTCLCPLLTSHSLDDLVCHVSDLFDWKWLKVILLKEIISAEAEQLKGDTDVAVVVKPVKNLDTRPWEQVIKHNLVSEVSDFMRLMQRKHERLDLPSSVRVACLQLLQHLHLWQSSLTVTINIFNDLQSHMGTITRKSCKMFTLQTQIKWIKCFYRIVLTFCDQCIQPLSQRHLLLMYTQSHLQKIQKWS